MSLSNKISTFLNSEEYKQESPHIKRMILLSEKIYGRRKDLGLSQQELAAKAETTQRIISQLEDASYASANGLGEDLYDRLAVALEIDRDYLFSQKIDRKTFELFAYLGKKLNWKWDIMQFMKLPYFVDLSAVKNFGFQLSNFSYIRWEFGPFDKNIYTYRNLFEGKEYEIQFSYIGDFLDKIDAALQELPLEDGEKLKQLSYQTLPMKQIGATLGGNECRGEKLDLRMGEDLT